MADPEERLLCKQWRTEAQMGWGSTQCPAPSDHLPLCWAVGLDLGLVAPFQGGPCWESSCPTDSWEMAMSGVPLGVG